MVKYQNEKDTRGCWNYHTLQWKAGLTLKVCDLHTRWAKEGDPELVASLAYKKIKNRGWGDGSEV